MMAVQQQSSFSWKSVIAVCALILLANIWSLQRPGWETGVIGWLLLIGVICATFLGMSWIIGRSYRDGAVEVSWSDAWIRFQAPTWRREFAWKGLHHWHEGHGLLLLYVSELDYLVIPLGKLSDPGALSELRQHLETHRVRGPA